jgi:hypothetical protein
MNPITFTCEETLPLAPEEIAGQVLDLTKWPDFHGYGPIPGIEAAAFDVQTPGIVGSCIRVTNRDGSCHIEEIVEWRPDRRLRLHMKDFSAPLSRLATGFEETWEFQRTASETASPAPSGSTPGPPWHGCRCGGLPSSSRGPSPDTCGG